jgi:hypothetical protein
MTESGLYANRSRTSVRFCLRVETDQCIDESVLSSLRQSPAEFSATHCEGAVQIAAPDQQLLEIEDDLPALVQNLCFSAAQTLASGQRARVPYFTMDGQIHLEPNQESVRIFGDLISEAVVPRRPLVQELFECGLRFIAFYVRVAGTDPDGAAIAAHLQSRSEETRRALVDLGIVPE